MGVHWHVRMIAFFPNVDGGTYKILLWQDIDPVLCNSLQVLQDFVDEKQAIVSDASMVRERKDGIYQQHVFLLIVGWVCF